MYIAPLYFLFQNDECDSIRSDFQAGVNTLYNKCVSCGVTPSDRTPTAISNSIQSIYTNRYNNGRTQGQNDVKNNPNGYGLYTKSQYDQNYNNGYNAGYSATQNTRCVQFSAYSNGENQYLISRLALDCSKASKINFGSITASHSVRCTIGITTNVGTLFAKQAIYNFGGNRSFDVSTASTVYIELDRRYSEDNIHLNEITLS